MTEQPRCISCGTTLTGCFCAACGEKRLDADALTFAHFLRESGRTLFDIDGRLWHSLKTLLVKPGLLTADYVRGRRNPYLKPIQLFLLINILYFFIQPFTGVNGFYTPLDSALNRQMFSPQIQTMLAEQTVLPAEEYAYFEERYNDQANEYSRTLIFLTIPLYALMVWALFFDKRKPFVRVIVFSLHNMAFFLFAILTIELSLLRLFNYSIYQLFGVWPVRGELTLMAVIGVVEIPYVALALRRVFEVGRMRAFASALLMFIARIFVIYLPFRFFIFLLTAWSLGVFE